MIVCGPGPTPGSASAPVRTASLPPDLPPPTPDSHLLFLLRLLFPLPYLFIPIGEVVRQHVLHLLVPAWHGHREVGFQVGVKGCHCHRGDGKSILALQYVAVDVHLRRLRKRILKKRKQKKKRRAIMASMAMDGKRRKVVVRFRPT